MFHEVSAVVVMELPVFSGGVGSGLSVVRDLRDGRPLARLQELADSETDLLAGFVLAQSSAGLAASTIRGELSNLEQVRK